MGGKKKAGDEEMKGMAGMKELKRLTDTNDKLRDMIMTLEEKWEERRMRQ